MHEQREQKDRCKKRALHLQTKQGRGLKGTRKSYQAERNGKGDGEKPSKHKEERRRQM